MAKGKQIRAFDLFCGGGGSSIGAKQAGVLPVGGVDFWDIATDSYQHIPGSITYNCDVRELSPQRLLRQHGDIELLLASPECTHHSAAKGNRPRCEESKQLAYQVVRFARALRPRWIVVENVIQVRTWGSFNDWEIGLLQLGYAVERMVLETQHLRRTTIEKATVCRVQQRFSADGTAYLPPL